MAKIIESTEVRLERSDIERRSPLFHPSRVRTRSSGVHLTAVLKHILVTSRLPRWENYVHEVDEDDMPLRMALGVAVEEFIASLYPEWIWQPGEAECSGIFGNCDGLSPAQPVHDSLVHLEEVKNTAKKVQSDAEFLADWYIVMQGKGYCKLYDTNVVRWHLVHYNGRYDGAGPVYIRRTVEFTDAEIENAWKAVVASKDKAKVEAHA